MGREGARGLALCLRNTSAWVDVGTAAAVFCGFCGQIEQVSVSFVPRLTASVACMGM